MVFRFKELKDTVAVELADSRAPCNFTFLFKRWSVSINSYCPGRDRTLDKEYNSSKQLFIQIATSLQQVVVGQVEPWKDILVWPNKTSSPGERNLSVGAGAALPHEHVARQLAHLPDDSAGLWPGMPRDVRVFRSADSKNTWQFQELQVRSGHLPDRFWSDQALAAVRVSSTLLEALVWARMMKGVVLVNNHETKILDATVYYSANVSNPRLDVSNETNLQFKMADARFETRCERRNSSLIFAEFAGLRGAGQVFLRKGKDQALDFSVGFDDRSLDQFRISNPLLHEPHVPMSEEVLNFNLRKLMHFLTPIINEKLQQMPFTLHKDYAQVIPCNHALAVGDTCPMQLRKVSVAGVANFAYLQIQEQQAIPTVTPDEHAEQDDKRLPVVLPWGQPVYAFSLPSQLSWLCLRCSNAIMLCAVSCGVALALFAALRTICCDPEVQPYAPLAPEDSRAVAKIGRSVV